MAKGILDLKHIQLPTAWDTAELERLKLREGVSYADIIADIDDALGMALETVLNSWLAELIYITFDPTVEYGSGGNNAWEDETERSQPDSQYSDSSGHMLPIKGKDFKLGWTASFLEEARRIKVDEAITKMANGMIDYWEQGVLTRLFKMEEETGRAYGLGTSGVSVPFCDGGAGTIAYTPAASPNRGGTFAATHDHYLRLNGITQANLDTGLAHLWEHDEDAPYELLVSQADIATWTDVSVITGFKEKADALVQYGQNTDLAQVDASYVGAVVSKKYGSARMRASARIPSTYWGLFKSYGKNDPRNPIYVRYDELLGAGARLVVNNLGLYPLQGAIGKMKVGFGVGKRREAAVLVHNDSSGDYSTPTIS